MTVHGPAAQSGKRVPQMSNGLFHEILAVKWGRP